MAELTIAIGVQDADDEELERVTRRLRLDLLEAGADDVRLGTQGPAPVGAKGDPVTLGALVVGVGGSAALTALVTGALQVLRSWVIRRGDRSVVVQIDGRRLELKGASAQQHQQAIDAFVKGLSEQQISPPALQAEGEHERDS